MSFSYEVKNELSRLTPELCCQKAELASIIRMAGSIKIIGGHQKTYLQVQTEHASTARRIYKLLKKFVKCQIDISISKNNFLKTNSLYSLAVEIDNIKDFLFELDIISEDKKKINLCVDIDDKLVSKRCCKRAYIRGAFLGSGSISDPKGSYHAEFVTTGRKQAVALSSLINSFGLKSKIVKRKDNHIVYLKEGDQIADLLGIMGAHKALLKFEDIRVLKHMRNSVNRTVNCETANLNKTISTSIRQVNYINYLKENDRFDDLPENLKYTANLRIDYPDLSLKELGQLMDPTLGKSGVSYRLKKIEEIAKKIQSIKSLPEAKKNEKPEKADGKKHYKKT